MKNEAELGELVNIVASAVGSLTNPTKLFLGLGTEKCQTEFPSEREDAFDGEYDIQ